MNELEGKVVSVGGVRMALLHQYYNGLVEVEPLPACSLGTRLLVVMWLREIGYDAV